MTTTKKKLQAKTAAIVAVVALVGASFVPLFPVSAQTTMTSAQVQARIAELTAQLVALRGQTAGGCMFARDLTVGSQGADVSCLQSYLASTGHYTFAGGTTGYFGSITQSAVARWQAANGVAPAAGYFGAISRAKYTSLAGSMPTTPSTPSTPNNNDDDSLSGGEADLSDFDLRREESNGSEGEEEVEVATAQFDVEGGDVRIERLEFTAEASNSSLEQNPWDYFDRVSIWLDGEEIGDMDVDDRDVWDETDDDVYQLSVTGLDGVVDEGDRAEITLAFDIADSIDTNDLNQNFVFSIADDGIRATDAEGIQQYIGDEDDTITFGFNEEETGDLNISSSSDDPRASILVADEDDESDEYTVFRFEIDNEEDVDAVITDLAIGVTTGSGDADDVIRRATLSVDGDEYDGDIGASDISFDDADIELQGDETTEFELMITLVRAAANTSLAFDIQSSDVEAEGLDSGDDADVSGNAESATHSIGLSGFGIEGSSTSQFVVTPGDDSSATYGTYTIRFEVSADEEDVYIDDSAASSGTVGATYSIGGSAFSGTESAVLTSTAELDSGFYRVDEGETETFTLTVTLNPSSAGTFYVDLDAVRFNDEASFTGSTNFSIDDDSDLRTDPLYVAN